MSAHQVLLASLILTVLLLPVIPVLTMVALDSIEHDIARFYVRKEKRVAIIGLSIWLLDIAAIVFLAVAYLTGQGASVGVAIFMGAYLLIAHAVVFWWTNVR